MTRQIVLSHISSPQAPLHQRETTRALARWLAAIRGLEYGGDYDPARKGNRPHYLVPSQTVKGPEQAQALGVSGPNDLFGGYVERPFMATKVITHPLVSADATRPDGWVETFTARIDHCALRGFSAFSREDVSEAAQRLLTHGPVRIKAARASGGREQWRVTDGSAVESWLREPSCDAMLADGVVIEQDVSEGQTFSVGQVRIADHMLTYFGTQHVTPDHAGHDAYGGSDLVVVRGDYDTLLDWIWPSQSDWPSTRPVASTERPMSCFRVSSPLGAITTRCAGSMLRAGLALACLSSPGGRVAPAVPKSLHCRHLSITPNYGQYGRRHLSVSKTSHFPPTPLCFFGEKTMKSVSFSNTPWLNPMTARSETVHIQVEDQTMDGTFLTPRTRVPGVLFVHGWGGSQQRDLARAKGIAGLGCICLTFDLRGHASAEARLAQVSRQDNLRDLLAAYDRLASHPGIDGDAIAVVGTSYGGYLASIMTLMRPVKWLALRVPAIYRDAQWEIPKRQLDKTDIAKYRSHFIPVPDNRALRACAEFRGDVLLVESEHDEHVPHATIMSYRAAFQNVHSLSHRIIDHADHSLSDPVAQDSYTNILVTWITEMVVGERLRLVRD